MKRNLIIVFCVLLGLSWYMAISEVVGNPKKAAQHVETAMSYEVQGIYVDAIEEYEQALTYEPQNKEVLLKMANAYLNTGSSKKFISICKELAEANQKDPAALDSLMNYYIEKNSELSAVKYLNEFLEQYPKNEIAQNWLLKLKGSYKKLYAHYEELGNMTFDTMTIMRKELYGIADSMGEEILEPLYEEVHPYSEDDLALIRKDGSYLYVDKDGQTRLVPDPSIEALGMMASDRTVALKNGSYAYLDEKLSPVTEYVWEELTQIAEKTGAGKKSGKWALLNKKGEEKTDYIYEDVIRDENGFCSQKKRIFVKADGACFMVNTKGEVQGELTFEDAKAFSNGAYAAVCQNGKWGFVNTDGELVIDCQYEDARSFSNGFAAVCQDGKWGYIDENAYMAIEPQFEAAGDLSSEGTAAVFSDEWTLIQLNIFQ